VNVLAKIQHTFRGDLLICLQPPVGSPISLTTTAGCGGATASGICAGEDNLNAIFDDEGAAVVCASVNLGNLAATPDSIKPLPLNPGLAAADGLDSAGNWTLVVFDDASGDSGTLLDWQLIMTRGVSPCQGACCVVDACAQLSSNACAQTGGIYRGDGVACLPNNPCVGRCCRPDGTCVTLPAAQCLVANGELYAGNGTACTGPNDPACLGRCCRADGTCATVGSGACLAANGDTFGGIGTACTGPNDPACLGRCCQSNGTCTVTSRNGCTAIGGTFTIGVTCTTGADVVYSPLSVVIPDNNTTGVTNVQTISGVAGLMTDVDVDVNIRHSFFGDLIMKVEHLGTSVTLIDRPGVPAVSTTGCTANDPDLVLDDEGTGGAVEDLCSAANATGLPVPPSPPNYTPSSPLSAFDGLDPNGAWTITVSDNASLDTGTLVRWSLHITTDDVICPVVSCACRGDLNGDTLVNGKDIARFAACVASGGGAGCACADVNNAGGVTTADIPAMISALLSGSCAP